MCSTAAFADCKPIFFCDNLMPVEMCFDKVECRFIDKMLSRVKKLELYSNTALEGNRPVRVT